MQRVRAGQWHHRRPRLLKAASVDPPRPALCPRSWCRLLPSQFLGLGQHQENPRGAGPPEMAQGARAAGGVSAGQDWEVKAASSGQACGLGLV